jgi:hypothetical protein
MWQKNYCAMCHDFEPSSTIIMDNGDQYFKKKLCPKNLHTATCQILIDKWQLMKSTLHRGCSYNEIA